jgi:hypothetical protein
MPRSAPAMQVPVKKQHEIARNELGLRAAHMSLPWLCWAGFTILGLILRDAFANLRWLTIVLVLAAGIVIFALDTDVHLRRRHDTLPGRLIGPVTTAAGTAAMTAFLLLGFMKILSLTYFAGGLLACICWNMWMLSADRREMPNAFMAAAEKAGVGGTRMLAMHRGKHKVTARLKHAPGLVTTADITDNVERLEGGMGNPPGSWTVTPDLRNAAYSIVSISDPAILDAAPLPWPGPSRPGASIAEPIRGGLWQDAEETEYCLLEHHVLGMGATGSGKTQSWMYNQVAEGITRRDYACLAADITKGNQFLGALRPALHRAETEPDGVLAMLDAVPRILRARGEYMAKEHITQWKPDCRLTFLDIWLEECADIVALLDKHRLQQWKSAVRAARSLGVRWDLSTQRADFNEMPTLVRGQMGKMCFGVLDPKDAEFGLTYEQRERGCRPQIWGTRFPGKCFIDALSIPEGRRAMPMRWWYWGPDSSQIAEYAALPAHAADRRPLDDVTGEALEAEPGPSASTAFPVPSFQQASGAVDDDGEDEHEGMAPVRQLRPVPQAKPPRPDQEQAWNMVTAQIAAWRAQGKPHFVRRESDELCGAAQRHSSWMYNTVIPKLVADGILVRDDSVRPIRWKILVPKAEQEGAHDERS